MIRCFWHVSALDQLAESSEDLPFRMSPHREEQMEIRVVAVRNGKCKIGVEERKK